MATATAEKKPAAAKPKAAEKEADKGSKIVLPTGEKIHVTARFTTVLSYIHDIIAGEKRHFQRMDGSGRVSLGPELAKHVSVEEVK